MRGGGADHEGRSDGGTEKSCLTERRHPTQVSWETGNDIAGSRTAKARKEMAGDQEGDLARLSNKQAGRHQLAVAA